MIFANVKHILNQPNNTQTSPWLCWKPICTHIMKRIHGKHFTAHWHDERVCKWMGTIINGYHMKEAYIASTRCWVYVSSSRITLGFTRIKGFKFFELSRNLPTVLCFQGYVKILNAHINIPIIIRQKGDAVDSISHVKPRFSGFRMRKLRAIYFLLNIFVYSSMSPLWRFIVKV